MNAVEAVEQLGTMGRKLQAREMGLRQPVAALRQAAEWEKVLDDPLAALAQVLGAAGGGQVRAKKAAGELEAPGSSLPLAPFRWDEDRPPAGSEMQGGRSGFASESSPRIASGISGGQRSAAEPAPGPAGGIRLARRQTSLLGILNANLEDRVYAQAGDQGGAAPTGEARPAGPQAGWDESPTVPQGPLVRWSAVPLEPRGAAVPAPFAGQDDVRQAARTGGGQEGEADSSDGGVAVERSFAGDAPAGMNVWGYVSLPQHGPESTGQQSGGRRESAAGMRDDPPSGVPAARNEEPASPRGGLHSQARTGQQPVDWNGWPQNADGTSPAQDGAWTKTDDIPVERPLSMAQIEQVLAALDERLELGMLRMYGTAGGLP